ncbi:hypothetical protein Trydic_g2348 [Trypoxylus dichotomus]
MKLTLIFLSVSLFVVCVLAETDHGQGHPSNHTQRHHQMKHGSHHNRHGSHARMGGHNKRNHEGVSPSSDSSDNAPEGSSDPNSSSTEETASSGQDASPCQAQDDSTTPAGDSTTPPNPASENSAKRSGYKRFVSNAGNSKRSQHNRHGKSRHH